jgi:hypothetical protein
MNTVRRTIQSLTVVVTVLASSALVSGAMTTSALAAPAKATKPLAEQAQTVTKSAKAPTGAIKLDKKQMEQIRAGGGGRWAG